MLGNNFVDAAAYLPFDPHEAGVNEMAHLPTLLATIEGLEDPEDMQARCAREHRQHRAQAHHRG